MVAAFGVVDAPADEPLDFVVGVVDRGGATPEPAFVLPLLHDANSNTADSNATAQTAAARLLDCPDLISRQRTVREVSNG